jgi:hypothetical protein
MRIDKTRLRWFRSKDSTQWTIKSELVMAGSEIVRVVIEPTPFHFEYKIICEGETIVLGQGKADTLRKAKQQAKERLKLMHARFYDEVRPQLSKTA